MGVSSRTGVISVVYEKGNKKSISNYRLNSFLNLEYQIYTTIYKNRMQKTLDAIIGENKSAAIKKITILHTFSIIRDLSNSLNKQLAVISLGFLKAFDKVNWDFIFSALHKFGYENKFIHMIQFTYINIQSKIKINGLLSQKPLCGSSSGESTLDVVIYYCSYGNCNSQ